VAALADALDISIAALLEETPADDIHIVRAAQSHPWPPDHAAQRPLERGIQLNGSVEIAERFLPPHHLQECEPGASGSRASLLVLQGKVIAGPAERISELSSGDYASFPTDVAHRFEAGLATARILVLEWRPAPTAGRATS
jgi:hypothetical protein